MRALHITIFLLRRSFRIGIAATYFTSGNCALGKRITFLHMLVIDGLALVIRGDPLRLAGQVFHEFGAALVEQLAGLVGNPHIRQHVLDDHVEALLRQTHLVVVVGHRAR